MRVLDKTTMRPRAQLMRKNLPRTSARNKAHKYATRILTTILSVSAINGIAQLNTSDAPTLEAIYEAKVNEQLSITLPPRVPGVKWRIENLQSFRMLSITSSHQESTPGSLITDAVALLPTASGTFVLVWHLGRPTSVPNRHFEIYRIFVLRVHVS
jgi:hypothetical protein